MQNEGNMASKQCAHRQPRDLIMAKGSLAALLGKRPHRRTSEGDSTALSCPIHQTSLLASVPGLWRQGQAKIYQNWNAQITSCEECLRQLEIRFTWEGREVGGGRVARGGGVNFHLSGAPHGLVL